MGGGGFPGGPGVVPGGSARFVRRALGCQFGMLFPSWALLWCFLAAFCILAALVVVFGGFLDVWGQSWLDFGSIFHRFFVFFVGRIDAPQTHAIFDRCFCFFSISFIFDVFENQRFASTGAIFLRFLLQTRAGSFHPLFLQNTYPQTF